MKNLYSTKPRERHRWTKRLTLEQFIAQHLNPISYSDARWRAAQADLTAAFKDYADKRLWICYPPTKELFRMLDLFIDECYPRTLGRTY